jgi:hypothetical protein
MVGFRANSGVVFAKKPIPRIVSGSSGMLGRSDDIGYQDRAIDAPSLRLLPRELELLPVQQPAGCLYQEAEQQVARLPRLISMVQVTGSRDEPEPRTGDAPRHSFGVQRCDETILLAVHDLPRQEQWEEPHCATEGRTTGPRGTEREREHPLRVPDGQLLRDLAAHRCAVNVRSWHPRGVHGSDDVVRHLLDSDSLIRGVGQARAAVIKPQNAKPSQLGQQLVPERQVERGARDQNERLTLAVDLVVGAGSRHDAVRHRASARPLPSRLALPAIHVPLDSSCSGCACRHCKSALAVRRCAASPHGHTVPNAAARQPYPKRRPSTRQLPPAARV